MFRAVPDAPLPSRGARGLTAAPPAIDCLDNVFPREASRKSAWELRRRCQVRAKCLAKYCVPTYLYAHTRICMLYEGHVRPNVCTHMYTCQQHSFQQHSLRELMICCIYHSVFARSGFRGRPLKQRGAANVRSLGMLFCTLCTLAVCVATLKESCDIARYRWCRIVSA